MTANAKAPNIDIAKEVAAAAKALEPARRRLEKSLGAMRPDQVPPGALADFLYDLKQTARLLESVVKPFDDFLPGAIRATEDHFVNSLAVGEASGVQGMSSRVQVTESSVPVVKPENWLKFWAWVAKTKQWDLLPRQVSKDAVRERWDLKKQVKFVDCFHAKKVSCTKLSAPKGKGRK